MFLLPSRPGAAQKPCVFTSVCCLRGLGRVKNPYVSLVFAACEAWGGLKTLCFHSFLLPLRFGAAQNPCVFIGFCCLRGLGRLNNLVFSYVLAAFEAWGRLEKPWFFLKFLFSSRPGAAEKHCVFIGFWLPLKRGGGSNTLVLHRFLLPSRPESAQTPCVFTGVGCLRGFGRLKHLVFPQGLCCL